MTIPAWLLQHLQNTGALTGRRAHPRRCPHCGQLTLTGYDADRCGIRATTDPWLLDTTSELAAILTGRRTYQARPVAGHYELDHRDQWRLRTPPSESCLVVAQHQCGKPLSNTPLPDPTPHRRQETATCPF